MSVINDQNDPHWDDLDDDLDEFGDWPLEEDEPLDQYDDCDLDDDWDDDWDDFDDEDDDVE